VLPAVHYFYAAVARLHELVVVLMRFIKSRLPPRSHGPKVTELRCDGCSAMCRKALVGVKGARVLCDSCASRLLNGESKQTVLRQKERA
jgi:hypothetical protein